MSDLLRIADVEAKQWSAQAQINKVFVCKTGGYCPRNHSVNPSLCWSSGQQRNTVMDREHVKGAADKAKGAIKEGAGKLSGDKDMETEGKIDKAKGSAHNAAGDVKDAARDAADALKK